jgi:hypothetical protein
VRWKADAGRGDGPRAGEAGGRAATVLGWAKTEKSNESFIFYFSKISKHFQMEFEILFEFSNRAHNTKYYAVA